MGRFSRKLLSAAVALSVVISGIGIVPAYAEGEIISNEYVEVAPDRYVPVSEITLPTGGALDTVLYDVPTEEVERINGALEEDGAVYIPGANDLSPASSYTYSSSYFYNNVLADSNEKAFYNALTAACNAVVQSNADYTDAQHTVHYNNTNTTANIIGAVQYSGFSEDRASFIFTLFRFSNPQFYFLSNGSGSGWSSDGTNTYYYLYPQFINTYGYDFALYNTRNTAQTALDTLTLTWMTEFNAISSDLDRELAVSNKIINYLTYDDPALSNNDLLSFDQSLISGVLRQTTVCAGYTMMTAYFLNAAGIESFYVNSDGHAWNLVKLYGNWYELDNTWADQDSGANPYTWERWRNKSHAYFLSYEYDDNSHAYKSFWNGVALPTTQYDEVQVPEEPVATPKAELLSGNTVSFKDDLSLNFLAIIDDEVVDGAYVIFTYNHYGTETSKKVYASSSDMYNNKYYRFRCMLTASELTIPVTASLYLKNSVEPVSVKSRSIQQYCISGLNDANTPEYERILLRATLNYGGYTQKRFGYNGEPYAYEGYQDSVDDVVVNSSINFVRPVGEHEGITYVGSSVFFKNAPFCRYYFQLGEGIKIGEYTFTLNGKPIIPFVNGAYYCFDAPSELAYRLDNPQTVVVKKGSTEIYNFSYSIIKWAELASTDTVDTRDVDMAKALYIYYIAAKNFVNNN